MPTEYKNLLCCSNGFNQYIYISVISYVFIYYVCILIPHENYFMLKIQIFGMLHYISWQIITSILKGRSSFIFSVKQGNNLPLGIT